MSGPSPDRPAKPNDSPPRRKPLSSSPKDRPRLALTLPDDHSAFCFNGYAAASLDSATLHYRCLSSNVFTRISLPFAPSGFALLGDEAAAFLWADSLAVLRLPGLDPVALPSEHATVSIVRSDPADAHRVLFLCGSRYIFAVEYCGGCAFERLLFDVPNTTSFSLSARMIAVQSWDNTVTCFSRDDWGSSALFTKKFDGAWKVLCDDFFYYEWKGVTVRRYPLPPEPPRVFTNVADVFGGGAVAIRFADRPSVVELPAGALDVGSEFAAVAVNGRYVCVWHARAAQPGVFVIGEDSGDQFAAGSTPPHARPKSRGASRACSTT
jgi:hypothetical protein